MGSELVSESLNPQKENMDGGGNPAISFSQIFYNHLPYYLALGMTWDQYWNDDVTIVKYYRQMDEIRKRRENEMLWLQGAYFYNALCSASPLFVAFNKRPKPQPYLDKPLPITKEMQEEIEREKYNKMLNKMKSLVGKKINE